LEALVDDGTGRGRGTWSETPARLPMKPFTMFDASKTLSLSDVSDVDQYFPSLLKSSDNPDY
jgi:hypothetical protein